MPCFLASSVLLNTPASFAAALFKGNLNCFFKSSIKAFCLADPSGNGLILSKYSLEAPVPKASNDL